ncbi:MAG: response regulator [Candidatus Limnocylindrales bacterium]|jgi:CheY-like chemotaxis protein
MDSPHRFLRTLAVKRRPTDEFEWAPGLRPRTAPTVAPVALVVDDEPLVRTLVSTVLRNQGWSVIEAADGPSALALAPETLSLLVTDYEMPQITGVTLAEQLRLRDDRLPVLMMSGHPDVAARLSTLRGPRAGFVSKPFPVEELISTIGLITG